MPKLRIYTSEEPEIRTVSREVDLASLDTPEMKEFIEDLKEAMIRYNGIGIAAPQVGHNIRMFAVLKDYTDTPDHLVLVNPRLVSESKKTRVLDQGCLSVNGLTGPVERPSKIRMKAFLPDGSPVDIKAKGMFAQILQHELDHLDGVLFIDKASHLNEHDDS